MLIGRIEKSVKKIIVYNGETIVSFSLLLATIISIGSCRFILHQPTEPEELQKIYKKKMKLQK